MLIDTVDLIHDWTSFRGDLTEVFKIVKESEDVDSTKCGQY